MIRKNKISYGKNEEHISFEPRDLLPPMTYGNYPSAQKVILWLFRFGILLLVIYEFIRTHVKLSRARISNLVFLLFGLLDSI